VYIPVDGYGRLADGSTLVLLDLGGEQSPRGLLRGESHSTRLRSRKAPVSIEEPAGLHP